MHIEEVRMVGKEMSTSQRIIRLSSELAEISSGEEGIEHFLKTAMCIVPSDVLGMVSLIRDGDSFKPGTGYAFGLDEAGAKIMNEWYLEGGGYRVDPISRAVIRTGELHVRRQDLIPDSDWYSDPHVEGLKSMGLDGTMVSIQPVRRDNVALVARRGWGERAYTEEERETLSLLSHVFRWLFFRLESDGYFGALPEVPNRHRQVLEGLLRGLSEKEIAAELNLSSRTVHKYVEHLYRHFGVNSRPRLMALWTRYPGRGKSRNLVVHH